MTTPAGQRWTHTKLCLNMQAAMTPEGQRWTPVESNKITWAWSQPFQINELTDGSVFITYENGRTNGPLTPNEATE